MKIAFDMDGTLIDFWGYFEPVIYQYTGNLPNKSKTVYDATQVFNISQETYIQIYREHSRDYCLNGKTLPNVINAFNSIDDFEFCIVTNRIGNDEKLWTEEWVNTHIMPYVSCKFDGVYLNKFDPTKTGWTRSKVDIIKSLGCDAMVEDDPTQTKMCVSAGIPTFYIINDYNKNIKAYPDTGQSAIIYSVPGYEYFPGMFESFKKHYETKNPVGF